MFWSYLCIMLPDNELQQHWFQLEYALTERLGKKLTLEDILLFIGVREAGIPPKEFTEREKIELVQVAISTILVPAKYYELLWVEDTGWPHFKQLQPIQEMNAKEKEIFYKKYILLYAEKNKMI